MTEMEYQENEDLGTWVPSSEELNALHDGLDLDLEPDQHLLEAAREAAVNAAVGYPGYPPSDPEMLKARWKPEEKDEDEAAINDFHCPACNAQYKSAGPYWDEACKNCGYDYKMPDTLSVNDAVTAPSGWDSFGPNPSRLMTKTTILRSSGRKAGVEKEALDNPFDGYGRPFSEDPLNNNMSEIYYHDNPASNVGEYSGPNSYSINTTAPYAPPHSGEEDPGQNVGPYNPPSGAPQNPGSPEQDSDPSQAERPATDLRTAFHDWDREQWFDGNSTSIYSRAIEAEELRKIAHEQGEFGLEETLAEQIEILNKTASEYDDSSLHEIMEDLPGGQVAMEYDDLFDGGLVDFSSFLHTEANKIFSEAKDYDWEEFSDEGARQWIVKRVQANPGILKHEGLAREAAIDYVKSKTMVLMDPIHRSTIIDDFVSNAERYRREAAKKLFEIDADKEERLRNAEEQRMAQVQSDVAETYEELIPGDQTYLVGDYDDDGYLNIGEDDGSPEYYAAFDAVESAKRDWANFTTEGARDWFYSKAIDSPSMLKHADITARAAKTYARDQVSLVPSSTLQEEVIRAFTESVSYLREAHMEHEGFKEDEEEVSEFESIYGDEDENLWT